MIGPLGDAKGVPSLLLPILVILWLAPRFMASSAPPAPAAVRAISAVRAGPSPESGRLEVWGLPHPDTDPGDLLSIPAIVAARARLHERIAGENDALALRARDAARRLEPGEDGLVGLRMSGWLIPFYGRHAGELGRLRQQGGERPWDTLRALATVLETRLEEPPDGIDVEISGQRRDLTRLFRETGDALRDAEQAAQEAVLTFQQDALEAAGDAAGPFRRRGRGRIGEIVLAALMGAAVREAVRRRPSDVDTVLSLSFAPVLALGVVLPLEGTSLLPVSPLTGTSLAFLPISFVAGFVTGGALRVASRVDRLFEDRPAPSPAAPPAVPPRSRPDAAPRIAPERPSRPEPEPRWPVRADRESVRHLAREVMTRPRVEDGDGDGDGASPSPPTEREVVEDPGLRPPPRPGPERLPFFPRR